MSEKTPGSVRLFYNVIEEVEFKYVLLVWTTDLGVSINIGDYGNQNY